MRYGFDKTRKCKNLLGLNCFYTRNIITINVVIQLMKYSLVNSRKENSVTSSFRNISKWDSLSSNPFSANTRLTPSVP
ncbi:hypothetical protein Glove_21g198 [Diversispora epigaea]|uniref:Uncharacterized protein n=1 Tax=Diversispora epigaea TaxID=1348612 RepID=A0A397JKC9_9GLOM|nr:hypothetical protein Glove_21g198 [Diversispora epigaea]